MATQAVRREAVVPEIYVPGAGSPLPPALVGGKGMGLARLAALGLDVPRWLAVLHDEAVLSPDGQEAVQRSLAEAGMTGALLAVRSSASVEDGDDASFAGQFETVLGVPSNGAELWDAVQRVRSSAGSSYAAGYLTRQETADRAGVRMAVVLQELVDAVVSGVAFSCDPVTGDPTVVIGSVYGLGRALVDGEQDGDTCRVRLSVAGPTVQRELRRKSRALRVCAGGGTEWVAVPPELEEAPSLTVAEAVQIAKMVREIANVLGPPQDVEWCLAQESGRRRLVFLQTRPITGLPAQAASDRCVWDNSNIIESYAGVTTPLTFTFARAAYEEVYLQFCRLMGVSEELLARHHEVFAGMLGQVRGRIYYNLLNWYRALSLLPGYSWNRDFMERMMGVRSKLADPPDPPYTAGRSADLARLVRMVCRLAREQRRLPRSIHGFYQVVETELSPLAHADLADRSLEALGALYRRLEDQLLRRWQAPIVNDFLAMIWFGVLGRLAQGWLAGQSQELLGGLLSGQGGVISTEPAREIRALALQVTAAPELRSLFDAEPDNRALWARLSLSPDHAGFRTGLRAYVDRFGERCADELKLETITPSQDPALLIEAIRADLNPEPEESPRAPGLRDRADAEARARLRGFRRWVFWNVLRSTRARVRDRENLRFQRTRVFGLARRIFLAVGVRLAALGELDRPRDVFYLTRDEILQRIEGDGDSGDLRSLALLRRSVFEQYAREPAPPNRIETSGDEREATESTSSPTARPHGNGTAPAGTLHGTGCCPGVVRAPVRIVRDPRHPGQLSGRILVAERTDPGWTLLFPRALGLLVERGSLLSHSAIVARETGLPAVVGVTGLMEALRDGELVEMDGSTGCVRRLWAGLR